MYLTVFFNKDDDDDDDPIAHTYIAYIWEYLAPTPPSHPPPGPEHACKSVHGYFQDKHKNQHYWFLIVCIENPFVESSSLLSLFRNRRKHVKARQG